MTRPFEKVETSNIKFALGIAEAGLEDPTWKRNKKACAEVAARVVEMRDELKLRGEAT